MDREPISRELKYRFSRRTELSSKDLLGEWSSTVAALVEQVTDELPNKALHDALPDVYAWYIHDGMTGFSEILAHCVGFQWDEGNADKNWELHHVSRAAAEETFFNRPLVVASDNKHSEKEIRLAALGKTDADRLLAIVFTVRENLVRVISARDMSRRERGLYEQAT